MTPNFITRSQVLGVLSTCATVVCLQAIAAEPVARCLPEDYVFVDAPEAQVVTDGANYSPRCLKVRAGTVVTIAASGRHPLNGIAPVDPKLTNPFLSEDDFETAQTRTLEQVGTLGYFCTRHDSPTVQAWQAQSKFWKIKFRKLKKGRNSHENARY